MSVHDELASLRRRLHLTWVAMAATGLAVLVAAANPTTVLRVHRLEVIDRSGEVVGRFDGSNGAVLELQGGQAKLTLAVGSGGPSIESRDEQGARRQLLGEEAESFSLPPPQPVLPADDKQAPVTIVLAEGLVFSSVEVSCPNGFRERAAFASQQAVVSGVPRLNCKAILKGGTPVSTQVRGGERLVCRQVGAATFCKQE